jgi:ribulose bisphosphate carboxylase small subunit
VERPVAGISERAPHPSEPTPNQSAARPQFPTQPSAQSSAQASAGQYFAYYGDDRPSASAPRTNGQSQSSVKSSVKSTTQETVNRPVDSQTRSQSSVLNRDMTEAVNQILNQGSRLGIEHVDRRRFRTGSWQSFGTYQNPQEAIAALNTCLSEHPNDYIRLVSIDPNNRRRIAEIIVQRPDGQGH